MSPIEDYIQDAALENQELLTEVYQFLKNLMPENVTEKISYGMPTFALRQPIIHFAPMKEHLGIYPTAEPIAHFEKELANYKTGKGSIQFPYNQPIPWDLLEKLVKYRLAELNG